MVARERRIAARGRGVLPRRAGLCERLRVSDDTPATDAPPDAAPGAQPAAAPAPDHLLRDGAARLGVALDEAQCAQLLRYLEALLEWNEKINVTAVREPAAAVERHLVDSLSLVPVWRAVAGDAPPVRFLDLGTGGGFPGVPLAVAWPGARALLIDGTGKKVRVVADCLARAGIANAEALQCRGHLLPRERPGLRGGFPLVVARAVGPAPALLREIAPLLARDGVALLMKGPEPPADELREAADVARETGLAVLPQRTSGMPGGDRGSVLVFRRARAPQRRRR